MKIVKIVWGVMAVAIPFIIDALDDNKKNEGEK